MQSLHSHLWKNYLCTFEATPKLPRSINGVKGQKKKLGSLQICQIDKHLHVLCVRVMDGMSDFTYCNLVYTFYIDLTV